MKRIWNMLLVCLVMMVFSSLVLAEENKADMPQDKNMPQAGMMHGPEMMAKTKMMGMKHMMNKAEMVATSDGGVVIMAGNKLYKYDKNLDLKKEVEIKMDMEEMCKKIMKEGKCPMMREKMKEEGKAK